jgi:hypothetical protein
MRKALWIAAIVVLVGVAGAAVFERTSRQNDSTGGPPSEKAARRLQEKIDAVKKASEAEGDHRPQQVEATEMELESYVLFMLRDDIPARVDSFKVQLTPGAVAADTQLTFVNTIGNPIVDTLLNGTHNLFVKGRLAAANYEGKFDLEEIRVDGIPVPKVLVETLINKYVKPKHPEVDLKEPFELPWKIERIVIEQGKATIFY